MTRRPPREFACILAPALPLQALLRSEPDLAGRAVAVAEGEGTRAAVVHVSRAARDGGVRPGMTPAQARSLLPDLVVRTPSPAVVAAASQALVDAALAHAPDVQVLEAGAVALDLRGTGRLHPSRPALACVLQAACDRAGLRVRVAVASGPRLAFVAARASTGATVIPAGGEAAFLAPFPIAALDPPPALAATLDRLGIRTVGAFAALDRAAMGIRLGPEAFALHRLARGEDASCLQPIAPAETFEESAWPDFLLHATEPLLFLLVPALGNLTARMEWRHARPASLRLDLELDPAGVHTVSIALPAPSSDVRSLVGLVRLALDERPPGAPVRGFRLSASPGMPAPAQATLFGPPVPEPAALAGLLSRLAAIAGGADRVGAPALLDARGHGEDRARVPFAPRATGRDAASPRPSAQSAPANETPAQDVPARPVLAFRRFEPPLEVSVRLRGDRPSRIVAAPGRASAAGRAPLPLPSGSIGHCAGPWYAESEWWTGRSHAGAAWDVELDGDGLYRLWHDLAADRWYVDGAYD